MSLSKQTLSLLQQLVLSDSQLQAQVQACASAHEVATLLVQAGGRQGLALQMTEMLQEGNLREQLTAQVLDDAALEQVAGGRSIKPPSLLA